MTRKAILANVTLLIENIIANLKAGDSDTLTREQLEWRLNAMLKYLESVLSYVRKAEQ